MTLALEQEHEKQVHLTTFTTMRKIEIDAGHRVPDHGSKCRALHGHRYVIEAHVRGFLATEGEQNGMTLDFGFIKDGLHRYIHAPCDHGLILCYTDPLLNSLVPAHRADVAIEEIKKGASSWDLFEMPQGLKIHVIKDTPTAEVLARHWFTRLERFMFERSDHRATLSKIVVWETPNCYAAYPG